MWVPEVRDDVVPGLDSILRYLGSNYATIAALQHAITDMNDNNNNIQTEIYNLEIPTNNIIIICFTMNIITFRKWET